MNIKNKYYIHFYLFTYRYSNTNYCVYDYSYEMSVILEMMIHSHRIRHLREGLPVYLDCLQAKNLLRHISVKKRENHSPMKAT